MKYKAKIVGQIRNCLTILGVVVAVAGCVGDSPRATFGGVDTLAVTLNNVTIIFQGNASPRSMRCTDDAGL